MTDASQYLLVCYLAVHDVGEPVSPGYVADELDRSPAVVTETLQRLEDHGYLTYEPYDGATLTAHGRERAAELYETYVVLSTFFRDVLDLEEPDGEAMALAGNVSALVTERVAETLLETEDIDAVDVSA
ncbi:metal-dependent transcriptional regulator [Natrinema longum]|uniref:Metal-dependent transcriptional regulator n=1 Tax=Natrinema longum TaxID=370324 RepID=A0A8A2UB88_9EURY|nr:metal-dependent transcriptional regulator [Natrinema longum]MBZ6496204.1 metal-dependent transcriptional regulator [Natrinema longum]QSW85873.1 metal-dependent transcriptional regulator [Natrinema longum]